MLVDLVVEMSRTDLPFGWQQYGDAVRFVCVCGELFSEPMLHCPFCLHHYPADSGSECGACHCKCPFPAIGIRVKD